MQGLSQAGYDVGDADQLQLAEALAGRTVEKHCVILIFPNRVQANAARAIQCEVDAASLASSRQDAFRHREDAGFQIFVLAKFFVNEVS